MGTLGKASGIFRLDDSDRCVGSYLLRRDLPEILSVDDDALAALKFVKRDGEEVVDETKVHQALGKGDIPGAVEREWGKVSLNEFLLTAVLRRAFPEARIERQVKVKNRRTNRFNAVDLRVEVPHHEPIMIEYDGPSHFIPKYSGELKHPLQRKRDLEESCGIEVVVWPYWIHTCEASARALFDPTVRAVTAIWSTNMLFGDFVTPDAANVIETITGRFNAVGEEGYGPMYEAGDGDLNKPAHPIIQKILEGKAHRTKLLPHGWQSEDRWLPRSLQATGR